MSFNDYKKEAKNKLDACLQGYEKNSVDDYFETEEVQTLVTERYKHYKDKNSILNGTGQPASVAHCLSFMY